MPPPLSGANPWSRWPRVGRRGCHRAEPMSLLCGEAGRRLPGGGVWCWPLLRAAAPMVEVMASHGPTGWLILGFVQCGWHGGEVSSTTLPVAPPLAPPSAGD
jgi:hypothetical protein